MAEPLPRTLKSLTGALEAVLARAGSPNPAQDARYMILKRTGLGWADVLSSPDFAIESGLVAEIGGDLERVARGEPLSRIYGERAFWGRDFEISERTLDPRIDTEILVGVALERLKCWKSPAILDLGTGSGCILLSLLCERGDAQGVGVDLAAGALETARRNAVRHGVAGRAAFLRGDWGDSLSGTFDLVVSNPPYISNRVIQDLDENVRKYDPILALDGGDDGLEAYRRIFFQLPALLKPGGAALFEIGFDQAESLTRLSGESGFSNTRIHPDSGGLPRVLEIFDDHPCGDK